MQEAQRDGWTWDANSEIQLNFKEKPPANEKEAVEFLATNPHLNDLFRKMIKEGIQQELEKRNKGKGKVQHKVDNAKPTNTETGKNVVYHELIKSPSDTTLYAPAINKASMINSTQMEQMMEKISDFVEGICLETQHRGASPQRVLNSPNSASHRSTPNRRIAEEREEKVEEVDQGRKLVIESEQFKAAVDPLAKGKGNGKQQENEIDLVKRNFVEDYDDDNYFHLICHVDQSLKNRIERGEYIELEKLLPK